MVKKFNIDTLPWRTANLDSEIYTLDFTLLRAVELVLLKSYVDLLVVVELFRVGAGRPGG